MQILFDKKLLLLTVLIIILLPIKTFGQQRSFSTVSTPRFTLNFTSKTKGLANQQNNSDNLAQESLNVLNNTYEQLSNLLNKSPKRKVILNFVTPTQFTKITGAPSWTSAMYFRNEITIPLSKEARNGKDDLKRALKHEYIHAIIAELSDYGCPAWLDEGIAQLLEGPANPLLGPALRDWIKQNPAMPLNWLQDGFITLDPKLVPAAYAHSLFFSKKIIEKNGYKAISNYLDYLKNKKNPKTAFSMAFNKSELAFEKEMTQEIRKWSRTGKANP